MCQGRSYRPDTYKPGGGGGGKRFRPDFLEKPFLINFLCGGVAPLERGFWTRYENIVFRLYGPPMSIRPYIVSEYDNFGSILRDLGYGTN